MKRLLFVLIIGIGCLLLMATTIYAKEENNAKSTFAYNHAKVIAISEESAEQDQLVIYQKVKIRLKEGIFEGKDIIVEHYINNASIYKMKVNIGDDVLAFIEWNDKQEVVSGSIKDYSRDRYLSYLGYAFLGLVIIIGGLRGIKSIITLAGTVLMIVKVFMPLIMKGYSPILIAIGVCILITVMTFVIIGGINDKTISAILGTIGGVMIAGMIALIIGNLTHLTGLPDGDVEELAYISKGSTFDYKGLLFAGIIMGALGAVMDVSMSIASSMYEIRQANPKLSTFAIIKAGMNIGKDIMGTMTNTLILAYTGDSIHLMLLFFICKTPITAIFNQNGVASEIVRALSGTIGLLTTIPVTAIASGILMKKEAFSRRTLNRRKGYY
jgi:uncharacterized membrane protein